MHPPLRLMDLQSPQRASVETCRQTRHGEHVVENWSLRLKGERVRHAGRLSCYGHGLIRPRSLPVSRPVIHAPAMLTAASTIGLAEPACRRPASAPGTSARPVSWRGSSPGPVPPTMCVGAPGEARKCAVCKNELFCPNYSHNEPAARGYKRQALRQRPGPGPGRRAAPTLRRCFF